MLSSILSTSLGAVLAPYSNKSDEIADALMNEDEYRALHLLQSSSEDIYLGLLYNGDSLLHIACLHNSLEIVMELIIYGSDMNLVSSSGESLIKR